MTQFALRPSMLLRPLAAAALVLAPGAALAHTAGGHMHGLAEGLAHPLLGLDHLAAMVAVGLVAARAPGGARVAVPAAFVVAMMLGALAGAGGVPLPATEAGIALSLVVLGLLVAIARPPPVLLAGPLAAAFGLFHGHAHGLEIPDAASGLAYAAGFVAATITLHAAGFAAARVLGGGSRLLRGSGLAVGGLGAFAMVAIT